MQVDTLRGPVPTEDLGFVLTHEHIFAHTEGLVHQFPQVWDESAAIVDADTGVPANIEWTASTPVTVQCASGERVISGGVVFTNSGNHEVGIVISQPFVNGQSSGWVGAITSNSGGTAKAEVVALCLK